jgi:hypothetical protein
LIYNLYFIFIEFLLEFKPEDQYNKVRDITEIAKRYIKTRFFVDAIAMVPFHGFFKNPSEHVKLFFMIKVIRI